MNQVNAGSTAHLLVGWTDANGVAVTSAPTSASYLIEDLTSGTVVRSSTAFPSLAASVDLVLTAADNSLVNPNSEIEERLVSTTATFASGEVLTAAYRYIVRRVN